MAEKLDPGPLWQLTLRLASRVELWKARAATPEAAKALVHPFRPGWEIAKIERWDGEWAQVA